MHNVTPKRKEKGKETFSHTENANTQTRLYKKEGYNLKRKASQ